MTEKTDNNFSLKEKSKSESESSRAKLTKQIREQIEFWAFDDADKTLVEEIVEIIADVLKLPPLSCVNIAKIERPAEAVAEIYGYLGHEHVAHVVDNYGKITYPIRNTISYFRTALYNSVFELRSRAINQVNVDMAQRRGN